MATAVVEVGDDRWDELVGGDEPDPYCTRSYLAAVAKAEGSRAVVVAAEGQGWRATYPLLLRPLADDRWLARTPEYGGPTIRLAEADGPAGVADAARQCRLAFDGVLVGEGVVSEVFLLSPWLRHRLTVAAAWSAEPGKPVCLVHAGDPAQRWARLRKGRRSDITRGRRDLQLSRGPLDVAGATRFAEHYGRSMERLNAGARWRFDANWFTTLADGADGRLVAATAQSASGGATALFLRGDATAAYFLASRWGAAAGASSLVLWTGIDELQRSGVGGITLGGGAGDGDDDPVLAFKRSFADEEVSMLIGARLFDASAHEQAVREGHARPLPTGAVRP